MTYQRNPLSFLLLLALALPVLAAEEPPAAAPPAPAADDLRWVEITPMLGREPAYGMIYEPGEPAEEAELKGTGRQLVCLGGETDGRRWALRCEEHLAEDGLRVPLAWDQGVAVAGRLWVEREPAAGSRLTVLPTGLETVRFRAMPLRWNPEARKMERTVESDPEGGFRLPPLAPGEYLLSLRLSGGRNVQGEPFLVPPPEELRRASGSGRRAAATGAPLPPPVLDLGDLVFEDGAAVRVLVLDPAGLPVEGATVGAAQDPPDGELRTWEVATDRDGLARLSGLDPLLPARLSCGGPGLRRHHQTHRVLPAEHVCTVERLARLGGRVVDAEGSPLPATVRLGGTAAPPPPGADGPETEPLRPGGEGPPTTRTVERRPAPVDDEGRFTFPHLPAGSYHLEIAAPGFAATDLRVDLEPGEERELEPVVLVPGLAWEGRVVDGATGAPVPDVRVSAEEPAGAFAAVTDEEGAFTAATGADRALRVATEAPGYPRAVTPVSPEALAADEPVVLEISRGGYVEVRFWDDGGEPCGGCPVRILGPAGESLQTDPSGFARSGPLPPGRYQVTPVELRSHGGLVSRSSGSRNRFADVRPGRVVQVVFGEPGGPVEVVLRPPPPAGWQLSATGETDSRTATPDAAGRATLPWPTGPVRLRLFGVGGATVELALLPEPPRDRVVEVELPTGAITGRLLSDRPGALSGRLLEVVDVAAGRIRARQVLGPDGTFHLPFLPRGSYALAFGGTVLHQLALGDRTEAVGELELEPGGGS